MRVIEREDVYTVQKVTVLRPSWAQGHVSAKGRGDNRAFASVSAALD